MPEKPQDWGLGALLNAMLGTPGMSGPGASTVSAAAPFIQRGVMPPAYVSPHSMPSPDNAVAPSPSLSELFGQHGVEMPSEASPSVSFSPPTGPLTGLFPGGDVPQRQDALSPGMTKGLDSLTPLLLAAGLLPLTQRGTGSRQIPQGRLSGGTMNWPMPSENLARLIMAQRRG